MELLNDSSLHCTFPPQVVFFNLVEKQQGCILTCNEVAKTEILIIELKLYVKMKCYSSKEIEGKCKHVEVYLPNNDKLIRTNYLKNKKRTRNMTKDIPPSPLILSTNIKF